MFLADNIMRNQMCVSLKHSIKIFVARQEKLQLRENK